MITDADVEAKIRELARQFPRRTKGCIIEAALKALNVEFNPDDFLDDDASTMLLALGVQDGGDSDTTHSWIRSVQSYDYLAWESRVSDADTNNWSALRIRYGYS